MTTLKIKKALVLALARTGIRPGLWPLFVYRWMIELFETGEL